MIRGHNYPDPLIRNGFDWKFDNSLEEYDVACNDMKFSKIDNGWMLNCYPENVLHKSKELLKQIRDFKNSSRCENKYLLQDDMLVLMVLPSKLLRLSHNQLIFF